MDEPNVTFAVGLLDLQLNVYGVLKQRQVSTFLHLLLCVSCETLVMYGLNIQLAGWISYHTAAYTFYCSALTWYLLDKTIFLFLLHKLANEITFHICNNSCHHQSLASWRMILLADRGLLFSFLVISMWCHCVLLQAVSSHDWLYQSPPC